MMRNPGIFVLQFQGLKNLFGLTLWLGFGSFVVVAGTHYEGFTELDIAALDKFRPIVEGMLYKDYMHDDRYLVRWVRAQNYNIPDAVNMLRNALEWRKSNKIDTILDESYPQYDKLGAVFYDGVDKDNRLVVTIPLSRWPIRQLFITGTTQQFERWVSRTLEFFASQIINQSISSNSSYQDCVMIADINGLNTREHLCIRCIPLLLKLAIDIDLYYPFTAKEYILINAPRLWQVLYNTLAPAVSERLRRQLVVFGFNKAEWGRYVFKNISPDQLRPQFGGTKED